MKKLIKATAVMATFIIALSLYLLVETEFWLPAEIGLLFGAGWLIAFAEANIRSIR